MITTPRLPPLFSVPLFNRCLYRFVELFQSSVIVSVRPQVDTLGCVSLTEAGRYGPASPLKIMVKKRKKQAVGRIRPTDCCDLC